MLIFVCVFRSSGLMWSQRLQVCDLCMRRKNSARGGVFPPHGPKWISARLRKLCVSINPPLNMRSDDGARLWVRPGAGARITTLRAKFKCKQVEPAVRDSYEGGKKSVFVCLPELSCRPCSQRHLVVAWVYPEYSSQHEKPCRMHGGGIKGLYASFYSAQ